MREHHRQGYRCGRDDDDNHGRDRGQECRVQSKQIDYVLDSLGRRVARKVNGQVDRYFVYQSGLQLIAELDKTGTVMRRFVYATKSNIPDQMITSNGTYRIVSDHLGSPRAVVNTVTGKLLAEMAYDEFGREIASTQPDVLPFGFAGGLVDRDTNLVHFGARDYDASVGRFLSKDPLMFGGGDVNLYSYTMQDPVNLIDPSGLYFIFQNSEAAQAYRIAYEKSVGPARSALDAVANNTRNGVAVSFTTQDAVIQATLAQGAAPGVDQRGLTYGTGSLANILISSFDSGLFVHEIGHVLQLQAGMTGALPEGGPLSLENFLGQRNTTNPQCPNVGGVR